MISNENSIKMYLHCEMCVKELIAISEKYGPQSPGLYSRLDVGYTIIGLQVWCRRHNVNVIHIDFKGNNLPYCLTRAEPDEES